MFRNSRMVYKVVGISHSYLDCDEYYMYYDYDKKRFSLRHDTHISIRTDNKDLQLNAIRFNSAGEALDWAYKQAKQTIIKKDSSFKSTESSKQGKLATDSKNVKDSDKLKSTINNLINYIKSINNATKGKKERYDIEDDIIEIKKALIDEFNAISNSKHDKADKVSMQASIRQISGYFGTLIKELEAKSKLVKDLTLSQFLHQQAARLNSWRQKQFIVVD